MTEEDLLSSDLCLTSTIISHEGLHHISSNAIKMNKSKPNNFKIEHRTSLPVKPTRSPMTIHNAFSS